MVGPCDGASLGAVFVEVTGTEVVLVAPVVTADAVSYLPDRTNADIALGRPGYVSRTVTPDYVQLHMLGLVTANPDDIDWADELRIAIEERVAMSPDALTGMEANLRFNGPENMFTRVFGRLTAWQNWIFQRPNAVGEKGALKVYGKGDKAQFDWNRV